MTPTPDYDASIAFLHQLLPAGPYNIIAIWPERSETPGDGEPSLVGKTFHPGEEDQIVNFLKRFPLRNCYYTLNPILSDINTKPSRSDIKELAFLHVDLDPESGRDVKREQLRIAILISKMFQQPTCVVFSGGGYQCIWRLSTPFEINGKAEAYDEAKLWNLQLELQYEADHCHNVDRIMRLPGTINHPDKKKREKGRTAQLARVEVFNDFIYPLSAFTKCQMVQSADSGLTKNSVQIDGNVQRLDTLDDLPVSNQIKRIIATGGDPDEPAKYADRSDAVWYVVCEMVREDIDDQTIYAIITDKDWGISAHVLDQSRPHDYAIRQIERAHDFAIDPNLDMLNSKYAVVQVGGKTQILHETTEPFPNGEDRAVIEYQSFGDFKNFFGNQFISIQNSTGKGSIEIPLGQWWVRHPQRRTYDSVVFAPGRTIPNSYNLWKGFAYEARPGDCELFLNHIYENLCHNKQDWIDFLMGWMATLVQHPDRPGEVAIVCRGKQGVGKGFYFNQLGKLFGRHYLPVTNAKHLTGNFNGHLQECVLLFADECFGGSDKSKEGLLKALITESTLISERKGIDATPKPNYLHIGMASNNEFVVPVGDFDRRFFVLDVLDAQRKNKDYFGAIIAQMNEGGYEALLHHLLSYDISKFDLSNVPATAAHSDQKKFTMTTEQEWWFHKLETRRALPWHSEWLPRVWCSELCDDFIENNKWDRSHRSSATRLGMFLAKCLPNRAERAQSSGTHKVRQSDGRFESIERPTFYLMPTLDECRDHWDTTFGTTTTWPDELKVVDIPADPEGNF